MQDWFLALSGGVNSVKAKGMKSLVTLVCWTIWRERNARIFNREEKTISRLITEIKDEAGQWYRAGAKNLGPIAGAS
jgi:predicted DNA-binding ribbon-helix-helix protein